MKKIINIKSIRDNLKINNQKINDQKINNQKREEKQRNKMKFIIFSVLVGLISILGCAKEENKTKSYGSVSSPILGLNNVMPTIGKIYKDEVVIGENDGDISNMYQSHLIYTLSADVITDNYYLLDSNGKCEWTILDNNGKFINDYSRNSSNDEILFDDELSNHNFKKHELDNKEIRKNEENNNNLNKSNSTSYNMKNKAGSNKAITQIFYNSKTKNYECSPVMVNFFIENNQNSDNENIDNENIDNENIDNDNIYIENEELENINSSSYDGNSIVTLKFKDSRNNYLKFSNSTDDYFTWTTLNTADRHQVRNIISSPTTSLFHRVDGLFQSGYTVYRGIQNLNKYIGSAIYEDNIKTPGASSATEIQNYSDRHFQEDVNRMNSWVNNLKSDEYKNSSVFVSNYGAPIALPPFMPSNKIDYTKIRHLSLVNNSNPLIITNEKSLYTMGIYSRFSNEDLFEKYKFQIKENNNWFQYSGVHTFGNSSSNKVHVGEVKPSTGIKPRFLLTLESSPSNTSAFVLNETDREYYILGNPNYNTGNCYEISSFNEFNKTFNFNHNCTESRNPNIGAVKIPGLQKIIGDGRTSFALDNGIYFKGLDGYIYFIDLSRNSKNYEAIKSGKDINYENILVHVGDIKKIEKTNADQDNVKDNKVENTLYLDSSFKVIDFKVSNNPVIEPTYLLNDGSIIFTARKVIENGNDFEINHYRHHLYINIDGTTHHDKNSVGNIKILKLISDNIGYGENGKLYLFSDINPLGVSYQPLDNNLRDNDYLAFIESDPVKYIKLMKDKGNLFEVQYSEVNINAGIKQIEFNHKVRDNMEFNLNKYAIIPYITNNEYNLNVAKTKNDANSKPFRNNSIMFVDLSKNANYNYIYLPKYFYGFDSKDRTEKNSWIEKENGLMAAEIRHNWISKVYGLDLSLYYQFNNFKNKVEDNEYIFALDNLPFKTMNQATSTVFFGNKVGIFTFLNFNTRKHKDLCQDVSVNTSLNPFDKRRKGCQIDNIELFNEFTPDVFYRGKSNKIYVDSLNNKVINQSSDAYKILEEGNGKNNNSLNLFVQEARMANFPNNENYALLGFEPQLLSSYVINDKINYPGQNKYVEFGDSNIHQIGRAHV